MKKIIMSLFALLILSCSNDDSDTNTNDETQIDLVTGVNLRSSITSAVTRLGNPNINNNVNFLAFPNPSTRALFIASSGEISEIWIVPSAAERLFQEVNFSALLRSNLYSENNIDAQSELKFLNRTSTDLSLNLEKVDSNHIQKNKLEST